MTKPDFVSKYHLNMYIHKHFLRIAFVLYALIYLFVFGVNTELLSTISNYIYLFTVSCNLKYNKTKTERKEQGTQKEEERKCSKKSLKFLWNIIR